MFFCLQVAETRARSEAHVAKFQGQRAVEDMLAKANADAERQRYAAFVQSRCNVGSDRCVNFQTSRWEWLFSA